MTNIDPVERYSTALKSMPASGGGGAHTALLSIANLGCIADLASKQVCEDLRAHVHGQRHIPDREIRDAVNKAFDSTGTWQPDNRKRLSTCAADAKIKLAKILNAGRGTTEADLISQSPVRVKGLQQQDCLDLLLNHLFMQDDLIFTGDRCDQGVPGTTINTRNSLLRRLNGVRPAAPFMILNPLDGQEKQTRGGGATTMRGDNNVADFRWCLVEFDDLSKQDQYAFFVGSRLRISAMIDTGNKSIHAWVKVPPISDLDGWKDHVEIGMYARDLIPLGVDPACKNPARLVRIPGHLRDGKSMQKLIYLDPDARSLKA
jgi:hypothetical protein